MNNELVAALRTVIQEALEPINQEIKEIKAEQQTMKAQLEEHTQLLKAIHHRQEETDAKLEALAMDVNKLHGLVADHDEKLNSIMAIQERQEKILERLALRSIEHEVNITELRLKQHSS